MPMLPLGDAVLLVTALTAATAPSTATWLWPAIAGGGAGLSIWLYLRLRAAQQSLARIEHKRLVLERLHEARDKQLAVQLQEIKQTLRNHKQDLGAQRKKNHTLNDALRAAQQGWREEIKRHKVAQNERPAFADAKPSTASTPAASQAAASPTKAAAPTRAVSPAKGAAPANAAAPEDVVDAERLALLNQVESFKNQHTAAKEALEVATQQSSAQKQDIRRLQRLHEGLRRIDIISRSKLELAEDKLRGMGRQYYEAISELALLKGEVAAPKKQKASQAPLMSHGEIMTPEITDAAQNARLSSTLLAEGADEQDEDEQDEGHDSADAPTILDDLDSEGESDDGIPIPSDFSGHSPPQA